MFQSLIRGSVKFVQKYLPEPFIFAIILTLLAVVLSMGICSHTLVDVVMNWGDGVWSLLAFSMQMAMVLVCGSTLADAPSVKKGLSRMASLPKTPFSAIFIVTLVSSIACWINWGFGLIIGVIFAKEIAGKLDGVDYRLLIASAYSGFVVWHSGLSASIPLAMATEGEALTNVSMGVLTKAIPISETIFSVNNLVMVAAVIVALTLINALMHPKKGEAITINKKLLIEVQEEEDPLTNTPAEKAERSIILNLLITLLGLSYLVIKLFYRGGSLDLNTVIMIFLFLGMILHKRPINYVKSFTKSAVSSAGILLQFPFYAGIMGIMVGTAGGSSLATEISHGCIEISNSTTFPLLSFLSAGIVNIFVPSGGGQWAVQAPIMMPAGASLGVSPVVTGMAIAWGDAWTNLVQPFWAIPALGIAKLGARDIMGFCLIDFLVTGVIICAGLLMWA
ncbi:short-chain fatty acid transporter [Porphyromonadaceae bacterium W3.11]|nr:short-chain fatty acid transporter [Porphyromonadaceae bacterium W3.11]